MIACVDVGYSDAAARAACVAIAHWRDGEPAASHVEIVKDVQEYQPGEFYRRELPCIEAVLAKLDCSLDCIVVDGYVWLDEEKRKGLGAHLYDALAQSVPVIGVAKNAFKGSGHATELRRGGSSRPLYVTAVGIPIAQAVLNIGAMHGNHRFPTVLKHVDMLSRGNVSA